MSPRLAAGLGLLGFLVAANAAYTALVLLFGYDDVLREPAGTVLARFHAGGPWLVAAWAVFAAAALSFAWAGPLAERAAGLATASWIAPAAALVQAAGLLRWVTAVPVLAAAHQAPGTQEAARQAAEFAYLALHQFAGAGLGEILGQALTAAWTLRLALALRATRPVFAAVGFALIPLWLLGLSEPLGSALPGLPVIEAAPIAFMAWEAWLAALAIAWLVQARQPAMAAPSGALLQR
jgi:hypothetical protein